MIKAIFNMFKYSAMAFVLLVIVVTIICVIVNHPITIIERLIPNW